MSIWVLTFQSVLMEFFMYSDNEIMNICSSLSKFHADSSKGNIVTACKSWALCMKIGFHYYLSEYNCILSDKLGIKTTSLPKHLITSTFNRTIPTNQCHKWGNKSFFACSANTTTKKKSINYSLNLTQIQ